MGNQSSEAVGNDVSEQDAEAAFNAGLKQVRGDRAPRNEEGSGESGKADEPSKGDEESKTNGDAGTQKPKEGDDASGDAGKGAKDGADTEASGKEPESTTAAEEREFAGLKESEWKAIAVKAAQFDELESKMTKLQDRTAGTLGKMSQAIKDLQNKPAGSGKPLKVVKEQLKRLSADFPELAGQLAEDLSEVLIPYSGSAEVKSDPDEVSKIVEQKLNDFKFQADVQRLDTLHPDRKEIIASDAYKVWFGLQTPEAKEAIRTSRDVDFVSSALTAHKTWRDRNATAQAAGAESAGKAAKQRDKRLDDAVAPTKGAAADSGKKVLTPEEEFEAGLRKVRGIRR